MRVSYFSQELGRFAVISFPRADQGVERLTPAEVSVALLAAAGATNAEIAHSRGTAERTVSNQVARVLAKLGVCSRRAVAGRLLQEPDLAALANASRILRFGRQRGTP